MDEDRSLPNQRLVFPLIHYPQSNPYYNPNSVPPPVFPPQYYPSYPSAPFYYYCRPQVPISTPSANPPLNLMLNQNDISYQRPPQVQPLYPQIENQLNVEEDAASHPVTLDDCLSSRRLKLSPSKDSDEPDDVNKLTFRSRKRKPNRRRFGSKLRRISFTPDQLNALAKEFMVNRYCPGKRGIAIANKINVSSKQVSTWFQNKRAKEKRTSSNQPMGSDQPSAEYDSTSMNPNLPISDDEGDPTVATIRSTTSTSSSSVSEV